MDYSVAFDYNVNGLYSGGNDGTKGIIVKVTELATGTNTYTSAYLTGTGDNSFSFNFTASNTGAYRITIKAKRSTGTNHNFNNNEFFKVDNITVTHQEITNDLVCTSYSDYRYGFNGMEKDDEVKGRGNSVNYKYRMHDPRLGRFFAVDPLHRKYPYNSPYAFSENTVINAVELEGLEKEFIYDIQGMGYEMAVEIRNADPFYKAGRETYEVAANYMFRMGFSHSLPRKLIYNYTHGNGKDYNLTEKEMEQVHAKPFGLTSSTFQTYIDQGEGEYEISGSPQDGDAQNNGTLGNFTIQYKGTVTVDKDGNATFKGEMRFYDIYDFDIKGDDTHRSGGGETQTMIAAIFLPGKGFEIFSPWVSVSQSSSESSFDWFEGKSSAVIANRLAELQKKGLFNSEDVEESESEDEAESATENEIGN